MKVDDYKKLIRPKKKLKYRNKRCEDEMGRRFDSIHEMDCYHRLLKIHGHRKIVRQVSMPVGLNRIRPDFMLIESINEDGSFTGRFLDSKGYQTSEWTKKAKQLEKLHGLHIGTLTKKWLR